MARFDGVDFYDIDGLLTEEEVAIRDSVREWVEERVIPSSKVIVEPARSQWNLRGKWVRWAFRSQPRRLRLSGTQ